ncbi:hypothetical protein D3C84_929330 [compost metagenome]
MTIDETHSFSTQKITCYWSLIILQIIIVSIASTSAMTFFSYHVYAISLTVAFLTNAYLDPK